LQKVIAIIPARGGSKRIPKKNIKTFIDKPMLNYAINACKDAEIFLEIMVSTDDNEILEIAKNNSASVPFMRTKKTADDFATTFDVLDEVISNYKNSGQEFDFICCVYPCVPFLTGQTLKDAYNKLLSSGKDALQPVCRYPVPIEWAMKIEDNLLIPNDKNAQMIRSQDLTPKYYDVGMFYFIKTDILLKEKSLTPKKTFAYIMNENEVQDIDTLDDWNIAELKYKLLQESIRG